MKLARRALEAPFGGQLPADACALPLPENDLERHQFGQGLADGAVGQAEFVG
jgi:hypothetical protein